MHKSRNLLLMSLAVLVGCGSFIMPSMAQSPDTLIQMCYRGNTIQIPAYLRTRYLAKGAMDDACQTSQ